MLFSSILLATLSSGQASESVEVTPPDVGSAVHPGRGPHRHPKRKPRPNKKKRTHRFLHGGNYGVSTTVSLGTLFGTKEPLYSLGVQSEARTSLKSSAALSLGVLGPSDEAWVDLNGQGRFYFTGNFEAGFFGGAGLTVSFVEIPYQMDPGILFRAGPVIGYKQILPGGMTFELCASSSIAPTGDGPIFLSGGQVGLGGSM